VQKTALFFLQTGTAEVLYDDHLKCTKAMKNKGTQVEFLEIKVAPYDYFGAGIILGFVKEAEDAAAKATKFVENAEYNTV
jgi:hypothetical protein